MNSQTRYALVRARGPALLDEAELARRCGLHPELVRRFWALGLIPAARHVDGSPWFSPTQVPAVARLQRLRAALPLNYAALGLVCDLLDRIADLETALRVRGRTEPVRRPPTPQPTDDRSERN
ncbi:chaperone modulator CbpM [Pseudonocardia oroxyli]|uniref:MerR HTH family regulatory protein n=1 Tax=Pseudonocardia oroxyli TaxID=366584 RepID=A0A1G7SKJ2_PSEOR|nr:chaperone modulator CbpM [Pseudonocardia oroxyli]SDG23412.1 MerR HTH family regulatory protein [Pseudonocardia oroxyli]